ncbi:hypothetical protein ACJJTC_000909 [Scirpophaga incertulas]
MIKRCISTTTKKRLFLIFITLVFIFGIVYLYLNSLQEKHKMQSSEERCISELALLKYQLGEVTEYKNRIDKLLTETQLAHRAQQKKYKDVLENCVVMKQQSVLCQRQFEDLQTECKKTRNDYNILKMKLNT